MPSSEITIINKLGLHARAAAKLTGVAKLYPCKVMLGHSTENLVDGKNIMAVMMLAASQNTVLHLRTEGEQEEQAFKALVELVEDYFGEGQ
ncbi:HPr family phosphocarrier protein [Stutzerimonas kirkiae]|uniref:HPr family phosphocarrier protein n=1 Tax=Stutzerimonas kirkiae TaxID=2211392 RepID=A0A4Q9RE99_9GAMM|nr:HPr family phosphocarrier protein [Stutzerimonas kirkiae]TBU98953.1 HPr family phosphocarrier protein [Stutzerimonas kirkiae]TBV01603.1 HPr family phosphocarrier protein [Stutzerimonas kirkiae]TBV10293.1 HPr family phosphocarrier protein [Stutzerimonas kirkiae]TBV16917.1 HPr family phosphocarrier protein [Stutzerimonas kirkiae]